MNGIEIAYLLHESLISFFNMQKHKLRTTTPRRLAPGDPYFGVGDDSIAFGSANRCDAAVNEIDGKHHFGNLSMQLLSWSSSGNLRYY